jgi:hypothetical protein
MRRLALCTEKIGLIFMSPNPQTGVEFIEAILKLFFLLSRCRLSTGQVKIDYPPYQQDYRQP